MLGEEQVQANITKVFSEIQTGPKNSREWGKQDPTSHFDLIFQDSIPVQDVWPESLERWELHQKGKSGETPDFMRTSLDQAGRFTPSLSDRVAHYLFLHF